MPEPWPGDAVQDPAVLPASVDVATRRTAREAGYGHGQASESQRVSQANEDGGWRQQGSPGPTFHVKRAEPAPTPASRNGPPDGRQARARQRPSQHDRRHEADWPDPINTAHQQERLARSSLEAQRRAPRARGRTSIAERCRVSRGVRRGGGWADLREARGRRRGVETSGDGVWTSGNGSEHRVAVGAPGRRGGPRKGTSSLGRNVENGLGASKCRIQTVRMPAGPTVSHPLPGGFCRPTERGRAARASPGNFSPSRISCCFT
jgi:hypothetical protein